MNKVFVVEICNKDQEAELQLPATDYQILDIMEKLGIVGGECTPDGKFSLDACRCVGACGLAPVMMINDEVYGRLTVDDIDDILAKYE